MNFELNNKYALVCGSTAGIGKATAIALAQEGVQVTLIARNEEKLKATLADLPQQRHHDYIVADFSDPLGPFRLSAPFTRTTTENSCFSS